MEARRTARRPIVLPIIVSGTDFNGQTFKENTWTIGVNRHGAKISTSYRLAAGDQIIVGDPVLGRPTKARVAWVAEKGRAFEVGIELSDPHDFWESTISPENGHASSAHAEFDSGPGLSAPPARTLENSGPTLLPKPGAEGASGEAAASAAGSVQTVSSAESTAGAEAAPAQVAAKTPSESLAKFLRDTRAELDRLLARAQETQRLSALAVQTLVETVHAKLPEELEAAAARFASDTQQRLDQLGSAALESFDQQVRSHQASLLEETLDLANRAHEEIDRSLHAGVMDYRIKLAESSTSALQKLQNEGKAFFDSSRVELLKALDESRKKADDDLTGHLQKVSGQLTEEMQRRAEVGFEILNKQLATSAKTMIEESQAYVAALNQSALEELSHKASETLQQHVNLSINALNEATTRANSSINTYLQQGVEGFQKQISEISKAALEKNSKASESVLHDLQGRLDQAARALLGGIGSRAPGEGSAGA